jgi:hypothetical protein
MSGAAKYVAVFVTDSCTSIRPIDFALATQLSVIRTVPYKPPYTVSYTACQDD